MAQNPFKTPEFLALFSQWNKKLEDEGFQDIEDFSLPEAPLKSWHNLKWKKKAEQSQEIQQHYSLAFDVSQHFKFEQPLHRHIWGLYCEGYSVRKIALLLSKKNYTKSQIQIIITAIKRKSGLRRD